MAETERLGRTGQLAHLAADLPEAAPAPEKKPAPRPGPKPTVPKPQSKPWAEAKAPAAPKPTQPAPQLSRPLGGISYAAVAMSAPTEGEGWTTVQRGGRPHGPRPQRHLQKLRPVQGLNLDQRKFVFAGEGPIPERCVEADLISAVNRCGGKTEFSHHYHLTAARVR